MEKEKKSYGFWDSLKEHPVRTTFVVALVTNALVAIFSDDK